jgi:hypothetical protein
MGKYKEETGKTRVGAFLETVAPTVLELAGDLTGVGALGKLGQLIDKSPDMSEQDKTIALEMLRYDVEDRKSARDMQVAALGQDDVFSKRFNYYLSSAIIIIFAVLMVLLFFVTIPEGNSEIVYMGFGTFIGIVGTVAAFYFGSSAGSKDKTDGLMQALKSRRG